MGPHCFPVNVTQDNADHIGLGYNRSSTSLAWKAAAAGPSVRADRRCHQQPRLRLVRPVVYNGFDHYVLQHIAPLLGPSFVFNQPGLVDNHETNLVIFDSLTRLLPARSEQSCFYWQKVGRPFAAMLRVASFPVRTQIAFLTFMHERLLTLMGPAERLQGCGGSLMTFDGSPVELSWVVPMQTAAGAKSPEGANREVRFAIEPMNARTGKLIPGWAVLNALTSAEGGMGLVRCEEGALEWSKRTERFLFPRGKDGEEEELEENGGRFFIGFDCSPSGHIMLKTYYLPCMRRHKDGRTLTGRELSIGLWDENYQPLRELLPGLNLPMIQPLEEMMAYVDELEEEYKPRLQILSMDCIREDRNRLKMYCRPEVGSSWADVVRGFTLNGRLPLVRVQPALMRLEKLWNLLFPFAHSRSGHDLDAISRRNQMGKVNGHDERLANPEHPSGGLLFYYVLMPGTRMVLPKVYLPVSRYCPNDLFIANAMESFYNYERKHGWVQQEVAAAYDHRELSERSGIHTYITFALKKNFSWEVTTYFSPEVWES